MKFLACILAMVLVASAARADWTIGPDPTWAGQPDVNVTYWFTDGQGGPKLGNDVVLTGPFPAGQTRTVADAGFVGSGKTIYLVAYAQRGTDAATRSVAVSVFKSFPVLRLAPPVLSVQ